MSCNFGERPVYQPGEVEKMEPSERSIMEMPSQVQPKAPGDKRTKGQRLPPTSHTDQIQEFSLKSSVLAGCSLVECPSCKLWVWGVHV